jgi:hypothetical protein
MIELHHPLAVLATRPPWAQTLLMVALLYMKHVYNLSDHCVIEGWA